MNLSSLTNLVRRGLLLRVVLILILSLAACSSIRFGYNHADTLLVLRLDQYLDLDKAQKTLAKDRIAALLAWHRSTQLHDYFALLNEIRTRVKGRITSSEVIDFQEKIFQRLRTLGERAAPEIARIALMLKPSQIEHLQRELTQNNAEFRERFGYLHNSSDNNSAARAKPAIKDAEFWLGELNDEQQAMIRLTIARRDDSGHTWADEREARQRDFLALLSKIQQQKPDVRVAADWVRRFFQELAHPTDPKRQAFLQTLRRSNADLIAQIIGSATPEQRATLDEKLQGYAEDLAALLEEDRPFEQQTRLRAGMINP